LLLPAEVKKLKVVILPTRVVQYCKHPAGGLKYKKKWIFQEKFEN
jgi:hypothetical protein